jgi:hypothetical protein
MTLLGLIGVRFNLLAAIVMIMPFMVVYSDGKFKLKTKKRIQDIAAAKYDGNKALEEELFLARNCSYLALPLLILGTLFLLCES